MFEHKWFCRSSSVGSYVFGSSSCSNCFWSCITITFRAKLFGIKFDRLLKKTVVVGHTTCVGFGFHWSTKALILVTVQILPLDIFCWFIFAHTDPKQWTLLLYSYMNILPWPLYDIDLCMTLTLNFSPGYTSLSNNLEYPVLASVHWLVEGSEMLLCCSSKETVQSGLDYLPYYNVIRLNVTVCRLQFNHVFSCLDLKKMAVRPSGGLVNFMTDIWNVECLFCF